MQNKQVPQLLHPILRPSPQPCLTTLFTFCLDVVFSIINLWFISNVVFWLINISSSLFMIVCYLFFFLYCMYSYRVSYMVGQIKIELNWIELNKSMIVHPTERQRLRELTPWTPIGASPLDPTRAIRPAPWPHPFLVYPLSKNPCCAVVPPGLKNPGSAPAFTITYNHEQNLQSNQLS